METKTRKLPERLCLGCNEMKPKNTLIRIVKSPDGEISLDLTGKKPGRGAYICGSTDCLKRLKKSGRLSKQFKSAIPDEVFTGLEAALDAK
ncbi:MAG: YlxR family protein [Ruminococcus sp.]|jgi:predicted RNA-binding protein YlxR (DUF448 family)|nr:YlxR family protein [Ruminococcus sp.]